MKKTSIEVIRADIARLKTEIEGVRRAGLPAEQVEMMLREALSLAESNYRSMTQELGRALASGAVITLSDLMGHAQRAESADSLLLGFAVRAVGPENIVADALQAAASLPQAKLRLSDAGRQARLAELQAALYEAETEEELLVESEGRARRPDANAAAVMGLPFEIAAEAGLLYAGRA